MHARTLRAQEPRRWRSTSGRHRPRVLPMRLLHSIPGSRKLRREWRVLLRERQGNQCCWCGKPMQHANKQKWDFETFEHLTPRSKGGPDELSNLALSHERCNRERSSEEREPLLLRVTA